MFKSNLLTHFGVFVRPQFLGAGLCEKLRSEMRSGAATSAAIWSRQDPQVINEKIRRTKRVNVSLSTVSLIADRLGHLKQDIECYFDVILSDFQEPQFLLYKAGDFFTPHQDNSKNPDGPASINSRQISVIIFLNDNTEGEKGAAYGGGTLTLYGLIDDSRCQTLGFPVESETGLLVAFRSDIFHEVRPVTNGERYSIVSWFF